ncbi:Undecaprenyl pyrophosphate synthase [Caldalkalibacillus thermarum TA2.A1]|uniref:Isoprenyl transferase n=1 Tax=Caldalkalibacillus thermarum (strain TA2.A1) TaxID=986075 RepID=F5L4K8_CALTT|nr:isoprenyl transferase [Caldalkalibacillus thermarum]EGL83725.1 Undecaprenyl pyrophosphate synthase [Caldalkalibacillus thermarum TA2.A1]QZT32992.1 isoprenyl transferase [Caldalkalibacillus thermarum TA2.A1]
MLHKLTNRHKQTKTEQSKEEIELNNIPRHVAIIMDGNGRWANQRGLPRVAGHRAGMKVVKEITKAADEIGVKILTLYAFSTENWKRPREEVDYLMKLPQEYLATELDELNQRNVQVRLLGSEEGLPPHTLQAVKEAVEKTRHNTGLILNFALNYGSRSEIVQMVKTVAAKVQRHELSVDDIDEQLVSQFLQTRGLPDPDLLIRTKEIRLSNFMLWQLAYTELWFADVYWPDFTKKHFEEAIHDFQQRARRYGSI